MNDILRPELEGETEFEKRRGVSRIEVRNGFAQVHISELDGEIMRARLYVLQAVADAGISIDFLKLSPAGMSFLVPEERAEDVQGAIQACDVAFSIRSPRSILLLHAVNIRDEEGMIADIVQTLIGTGASVDHLGDMHDRILMVLKSEDVDRVAQEFRKSLMEGEVGVAN